MIWVFGRWFTKENTYLGTLMKKWNIFIVIIIYNILLRA